MKCKALIFACALGIAAAAEARMGETVEECQRRYDAAVTNYPGHGELDGVAVYLKDGIYVTVFFTKRAGAVARASMVIYSRLRPDTKNIMLPPPEITEKEQAALLGTVPGRWEDYESRLELKGKPDKLKPISTHPSITIKQRDATAEVVKKVVEALYEPNQSVWIRTPFKNVAHNGPKVFAFRVARGIAICSQDGAEGIRVWADRGRSESAAANKPPDGQLSGF